MNTIQNSIRLLILTLLFFATTAQAKPLVNCDLQLDRQVLPAGQTQKTVIKIALEVPEIPLEGERPQLLITVHGVGYKLVS